MFFALYITACLFESIKNSKKLFKKIAYILLCYKTLILCYKEILSFHRMGILKKVSCQQIITLLSTLITHSSHIITLTQSHIITLTQSHIITLTQAGSPPTRPRALTQPLTQSLKKNKNLPYLRPVPRFCPSSRSTGLLRSRTNLCS